MAAIGPGICAIPVRSPNSVEFWQEKFEKNVARDRRAIDTLLADGWRVGVVWECLFKDGDVDRAVEELGRFLKSSENDYLELPPDRTSQAVAGN